MRFVTIFSVLFSISLSLSASATLPLTPPPSDWNQPGISLRYLRFWYTGPGCFYQGAPPLVPSHLLEIARLGGVMVETTEGYRMMVPFDPILITNYRERYQIDDLIVSTPGGMALYPRYQRLPQDNVEVFQRPLEAGLCPLR